MASMEVQASNWLQRNHGIKVPGDWLNACIEWLQEEHQGTLSQLQLFNQVFDQWLFADLHEIAFPSLPNDLNNMAKIQLEQVFCLQVNSIVDVGASYYSQLQKVTGKENANAEVSATQPAQPFWEPKPKRMLMMQLTDGVTEVKGMEYKHIPALNSNLPAGVKVKIKGKVLCRKGVLMLQSENVEVMGGEVEGLMETNTHQINLQNKLEGNVNNPTRPETKEFRQDNKTVTKQKPNNVRQQNNNVQGRPQVAASGRQPVNQARNSGQSRSMVKQQSQALEELGNEWDDDDFDLDDIMQQLDSPVVGGRSQNSTQSQMGQTKMSQTQLKTSQAQLKTSQVQLKTSQAQLKTSQKPPGGIVNNAGRMMLPSGGVNSNNNSNSNSFNSALGTANISMNNQHQGQVAPNKGNVGNKLSCQNSAMTRLTNNQPIVGSNITFSNVTININTGLRPAANQSSTSMPRPQTSRSIMNNCTFNSYPGNGNQNAAAGHPNNQLRNASAPFNTNTATASINTRPNVPIKKEPVRDVLSCEQYSHKRKSEEFEDEKMLKAVKTESKVKSEVKLERPWVYLCHILANPPPVCFVKAYISTVVGKIDHHDGRFWSLPVKINDGSATLDVDLSDQFLTTLMGFTASSYKEMKARLPREPQLKGMIMSSINKCQRQIVELNAILELHFSPNNPRPVVAKAVQLSDVHLNALTNIVGSQ